jgi:hypothetical protein
MAEITEAGYQTLRDFIVANWTYVELRDAGSDPVLRLGTDDPRVSWTHQEGAQVLELTVVLRGSDADVSLGTAFTGSAIFSVAAGGSALSDESFTPFTIADTADQLTIRHRFEVPKVQES